MIKSPREYLLHSGVFYQQYCNNATDIRIHIYIYMHTHTHTHPATWVAHRLWVDLAFRWSSQELQQVFWFVDRICTVQNMELSLYRPVWGGDHGKSIGSTVSNVIVVAGCGRLPIWLLNYSVALLLAVDSWPHILW